MVAIFVSNFFLFKFEISSMTEEHVFIQFELFLCTYSLLLQKLYFFEIINCVEGKIKSASINVTPMHFKGF